MSGELVRYDAMCHAIEVAYRVDEVKDLRDKAMALEAYARQAKNVEAERQACEIRLRAERRAGQLLIETAKSGERELRGGDRRSNSRDVSLKTLADYGISDNQSSRWQQLADVSHEDFERALVADDKPSTNSLLRILVEPSVTPVNPGALWLWGRLQDFERTHLARDPGDVLATLTPSMRADVLRLAPLVAHWLVRLEEADAAAT